MEEGGFLRLEGGITRFATIDIKQDFSLARGAALLYKMFDITRLVTQPPRHIIKHTSLLSLRTDDYLSIKRLILLSVVDG